MYCMCSKMTLTQFEVIWVLDKNGLCFIQRIFTRKYSMDEVQFSGLITSIMMFAKDIFDEDFEKLKMGDKEIFIRSFAKCNVVLASKRGETDPDDEKIYNILEEIGQSFQVEYKNLLNSDYVIDSTNFSNFGQIIDQICGIETFIYLEEHDQIIKLLKDAENFQWDEVKTSKQIAFFLDGLNDYKLEIIIETFGDALSPFLSNNRYLTHEQKKRFKKLLH